VGEGIQRPARRSQVAGAGGRLRRSAAPTVQRCCCVLWWPPHGPRGYLIKALPVEASATPREFLRSPLLPIKPPHQPPCLDPCSRAPALRSLLTPRLCLSLHPVAGRIVLSTTPPTQLDVSATLQSAAAAAAAAATTATATATATTTSAARRVAHRRDWHSALCGGARLAASRSSPSRIRAPLTPTRHRNRLAVLRIISLLPLHRLPRAPSSGSPNHHPPSLSSLQPSPQRTQTCCAPL
jgi:hypothetical protein